MDQIIQRAEYVGMHVPITEHRDYAFIAGIGAVATNAARLQEDALHPSLSVHPGLPVLLWPGGGLGSHSGTHLHVLFRQRLAVQASSLKNKYLYAIFFITDIGQGQRVAEILRYLRLKAKDWKAWIKC